MRRTPWRSEPGAADEGDDTTAEILTSRSSNGYIREGKFAEVEPLLAEYVKQQPGSSWGWYALGYSQFAQQKIGDVHQGAGEVARARHPTTPKRTKSSAAT